MLIWGSLILISTLLFSFFLGHNKIETPRLSISKIVANTVVMDQQLSINSKTKEDLLKNQMWVQVLDEQGNEIFFFNKPKTIPNHYIPGELVSDYLYP
ncbi:sensor histidine kinase, partial [Peribacillus frigoritolerans]